MYIGLNNLGLTGLRGSFSPGSLFAGGAAGVWLDETDPSMLYQDSAGTSPVVAASNPEGLVLDKRIGRGPQLLANGTFDTNISGWTAFATNSNIAWVAGTMQVSRPTSGLATGYATATTVIGQTYLVQGTVTSVVGAGFVYIGVSTTSTSQVSIGTSDTTPSPSVKSFFFTATTTTTYIHLAIDNNTGAASANWDNLTVQLVSGNHFLQATTTTRPLYNVSPSRMTFDGVDDNLATASFTAGTLTNNMDFFCTLKRSSSAAGLLVASGTAGAHFFGSYNASAGTTTTGCGAAFSNFVNGVSIPDDRTQLNTALTVGSWVVFEVHNLDLSALTQLGISIYGTGLFVAGEISEFILCPAQTDPVRKQVRSWVGSTVGLTL